MEVCCTRYLKSEFWHFCVTAHKDGPVVIPRCFMSNKINASINMFGGITFLLLLFTSKSIAPWFTYNMELIKIRKSEKPTFGQLGEGTLKLLWLLLNPCSLCTMATFPVCHLISICFKEGRRLDRGDSMCILLSVSNLGQWNASKL